MVPSAAAMGHPLTTLLVGYGNLHASNGDMLKAYVKFNDMIRMEFAIQDPDTDDAEAPANFPNADATGATNREENDIPRLDIAFPITIGNFTIEPSATYLTQDYDQVAPGYEDSIDIWGVAVGAKAGFGPVTISAEITYGHNLGNGNYTGAGHAGSAAAIPARARAVDANGDGIANEIEDSDVWMGWIQFDFNFGPATLKLAWGIEDVQNDGGIIVGDEVDTTRMGYALALPINVAKGFTITPTVIYFDRDDSAHDGTVRAGNPDVDYGDQLLVGVQFNLKF
jgi:hypothetical protein